jgi:hypothetical protein
LEVRISSAHRERARHFALREPMCRRLASAAEMVADHAAAQALAAEAALKEARDEKLDEEQALAAVAVIKEALSGPLDAGNGVEYELWRSRIPQAMKPGRERSIKDLERGLRYWRSIEARERARPGFSKYRRTYDYVVAMRRKYERLARYPWLPVVPDPPEPK